MESKTVIEEMMADLELIAEHLVLHVARVNDLSKAAAEIVEMYPESNHSEAFRVLEALFEAITSPEDYSVTILGAARYLQSIYFSEWTLDITQEFKSHGGAVMTEKEVA